MIADPVGRGRALAAFHAAVSPRLYRDLVESGLLGPGADGPRALEEWSCFSLYACVRGLVAAGGFNRETGAAIDAFHEAVLEAALAELDDLDALAARRKLISERYAEYGGIGQEGGAAGAATVGDRLGAAAARHMTGAADPPAELGRLSGLLHETLVEGAAEAVRAAGG